ncbi:hydrolase 76 protein, partial [Kappamyces sp. JEL0680]
AINHAARLGILTGTKKYFEDADSIYKWMRTSGILQPNYSVFDGADFSTGQCRLANDQVSYQPGTLAGALAWLYKGTGTLQYLTDAHNIFNQALTQFTRNNVIFDTCEVSGKACQLNQATPKGTAVRGFGYLHEFTNSADVRAKIKAMLLASVQGMMKTCDKDWNCGQDWIGGNAPASSVGYNVHFQMNALELMTAYMKTFYTGPVGKGGQLAPNTASTESDGPPPPFNSQLKSSVSTVASAAAICAVALFA